VFKYWNHDFLFEIWRCVALGKVLVTAAWPYINHIPHLGNLLPILSADVIARYHRLKGDEVVFVSGSDEHGTPVEVEAIKRGIQPEELTSLNHQLVSDLFKKWEISFDNYTRTENPVHKDFVREVFLKIYKNGYVFTQETELPYCPRCNRFLPDRFVEGECPYCNYKGARGDQCEGCGRLLEPTKLIGSHCTICGSAPEIRRVTHWYFDMPKFDQQLLRYIEENKQLPDNARNFSLNLLKEGLKPRPITRDNKWGIPAPFPGAEKKTIYVWLEAVLGYVSATIEYFKKSREEEKWKEYWFDKDVKTLYFIGKDNIPFHTLILPALLIATNEGYNLPWNVSTNEFLIFEGQKSSKSRGIGIWIDEALQLFPVDYWRYTLISMRPETKDVNFTWEIFIEKVNSDLNDTLGNFIHRTLKFIDTYFNGEVPKPQGLDDLDKDTDESIKKRLKKITRSLEKFQLQTALREVTELSRLGNKYLNEKQPWKTVKTDPQSTANALYIAVQIVKALAITLEPFIPSTAKELWSILNLQEKPRWEEADKPLPPGHKISKAEPLFHKVESSEEKLQEMLDKVRSTPQKVSAEEFSKIDLRIGKVVKAEMVPRSKKLLKLTIDIGDNHLKTAVAGIAEYYMPKQLEEQQVAVIVNLEPRKVFGIESEVMILAAQDENTVTIIRPEKPIKTGSKIS